jgi:hypothetical protein
MRVGTFVLVFILSGLMVTNSSAQNQAPDSLLFSNSATQAIDHFNKTISFQSEIYNGAQYELYPPANRGTFYFRDKNYCVPALIRYDGTWYKNIPVLYDIYHGAMISISDNGLYILRPGKVSDVYLLDHHFIYLDTESPGSSTPGFYDLLYKGKSQVMVKQTKLIDETKTTEIVYEDRSDIYVKKDNKYYLVSSKGSLMDIFKDKKKELNQYLKDNKINYYKDKEGAVAKLAGYYDQINK